MKQHLLCFNGNKLRELAVTTCTEHKKIPDKLGKFAANFAKEMHVRSSGMLLGKMEVWPSQ